MSNLPANITTTIQALEASQAHTPVMLNADFNYLKMDKTGVWVYGANETEVDAESAFVIEPMSYAQGYVAWDNNQLIDEKMAPAGKGSVTLADLPDLGMGAKGKPIEWKAQTAFAMKGVDGAEEGEQFLYKTSSKGGNAAIAKLLAEIIERGKAGETAICPVVVLESTFYKHKEYGKIYTPILTVDEWVDAPAPDAEPAPKAKVEAKEPEPEPEPKAAPRRKRARTAA